MDYPRHHVLAVLLLGSSCVAGSPFLNSSLDFNRGRPQRVVIQGERELVEEALITIFNEREGLLARRRQLGTGATLLSFRREIERVAGTTTSSSSVVGGFATSSVANTEFDYLSYGSLYYVEVSGPAGSVVVEVVGLPVVEGVTACPTLLRERDYRDCIAQPPPNTTGESYADWATRQFDVPSNGRRESEFIAGVFAELSRKKWRDSLASPADKAFNR
ncbi:MAG: hypothetical protein INH41_03590 [Myxococcaceae bacterium]|jgi:hypothetical protein|nr:hypothetical protein [Myxococcaceae bacterium]